jgi:hypothetical protein
MARRRPTRAAQSELTNHHLLSPPRLPDTSPTPPTTKARPAQDLMQWATSTLLGGVALDATWRQVGHRITTVRWRNGRMVPIAPAGGTKGGELPVEVSVMSTSWFGLARRLPSRWASSFASWPWPLGRSRLDRPGPRVGCPTAPAPARHQQPRRPAKLEMQHRCYVDCAFRRHCRVTMIGLLDCGSGHPRFRRRRAPGRCPLTKEQGRTGHRDGGTMRRVLGLLFAVWLSAALGVGLSRQQPAAAEDQGDPVIAAAGDIACAPPATRTSSKCHQQDTANLLAAGGYTAVLPVGDTQYDCGQLSAFQAVYDSTWGQAKSISHPVVGDDEYGSSICTTPGAAGYFTYFGDAASPQQAGCTSACTGYYSYDLGSWHIVALNTECSQTGVGGCKATSPQGKWLAADLAAHPAACTLAYWHRPYFNDDGTTSSNMSAFVKTLYAAHADVLLVGHKHFYERFAPMDPFKVADPNGLRQFIVGTGGKSHGSLATTPPPNAEARDKTAYGILRLTLHAGSYDWQFVPEAGKTFTDAGTQACHNAPSP